MVVGCDVTIYFCGLCTLTILVLDHPWALGGEGVPTMLPRCCAFRLFGFGRLVGLVVASAGHRLGITAD